MPAVGLSLPQERTTMKMRTRRRGEGEKTRRRQRRWRRQRGPERVLHGCWLQWRKMGLDWVVGWKGGERKWDGKKKGEEKERGVAAGGGGGDRCASCLS